MSDAADVRMTSNRPYLIRAMYEWIGDNGLTPYLLVDAAIPGLQVPPASVKDGRVVLNVAARAVAQLELGNSEVRFMARFSGVSHSVRVPVSGVLAIYAHETGQGMMLPREEGDEPEPTPPEGESAQADEPPKPRGHLRVIK